MLQVIPGARHLWQLKTLIYPELIEKSVQINLPTGLIVKEQQRVQFSLSITGEQVLVLLDMTPYAWRASDKVKHLIRTQVFNNLEIDFILVLAQKSLIRS